MTRSIIIRIIIDTAVFFFVVSAWWFVALPVVILCMWLFPNYLETIAFGLIYDALFGMTQEIGWKGYIGFIVGILVFVFISFLKGSIRK